MDSLLTPEILEKLFDAPVLLFVLVVIWLQYRINLKLVELLQGLISKIK